MRAAASLSSITTRLRRGFFAYRELFIFFDLQLPFFLLPLLLGTMRDFGPNGTRFFVTSDVNSEVGACSVAIPIAQSSVKNFLQNTQLTGGIATTYCSRAPVHAQLESTPPRWRWHRTCVLRRTRPTAGGSRTVLIR